MEYIYTQEVDLPGRKTRGWTIHNKKSEAMLGVIQWYAPWRQYCFYPVPATVFSAGCLSDIQNFITAQMEERRRGKLK